MGCRKLTYYPETELKAVNAKKELTTKISSQRLRSSYLFGFNGQEKDDEVAGAGNTNTAEFWEYDTRLGRRWNLDPVVKPWQSDYVCLSNNPLRNLDIKGDSDYAINKNGNIRLIKPTNDDFDQLFKVDDKGKKIKDEEGKIVSEKIEKGVLSKPVVVATIQKEKCVDSHIYFFSNKENADIFFGFVIKNTVVEWSDTEAEKNGNEVYTVGTKHNEHRTGLVSQLKSFGYNIIADAHNHPSGREVLSSKDINVAKNNPNTKFRLVIVLRQGSKDATLKYLPFDSNGFKEK